MTLQLWMVDCSSWCQVCRPWRPSQVMPAVAMPLGPSKRFEMLYLQAVLGMCNNERCLV
jgi:hypothetical protein